MKGETGLCDAFSVLRFEALDMVRLVKYLDRHPEMLEEIIQYYMSHRYLVDYAPFGIGPNDSGDAEELNDEQTQQWLTSSWNQLARYAVHRDSLMACAIRLAPAFNAVLKVVNDNQLDLGNEFFQIGRPHNPQSILSALKVAYQEVYRPFADMVLEDQLRLALAAGED